MKYAKVIQSNRSGNSGFGRIHAGGGVRGRRKTLIHFVSHGKELPTRQIGDRTDPGFGGDLVYTPKKQDLSLREFRYSGHYRCRQNRRSFRSRTRFRAQGESAWKAAGGCVGKVFRLYHSDEDSRLNFENTILFINEKALSENHFQNVINAFYVEK